MINGKRYLNCRIESNTWIDVLLVDVLALLEVIFSGIPLVVNSLKHFKNKIRENRKKKVRKELVALVVIEVGKSVIEDVRSTFGEPGAVISYPKTVDLPDIPKIAAEVYQGILLLIKKLKEEGLHDQQLTLVLSGPVSLSFQIGQAIGFNYNIQLVHWDSATHDYTIVPKLTRKLLDSHSPNMKKPRKRSSVDKPILSINVGGKGVFSALKKSFGNRVFQGVSYTEIDMIQVPTIATEVFLKVTSFASVYDEIGLALSGPLVLNFQIGQALGFNFNIALYQWQQGKYIEIPLLTRDMLII